MLDRAWVPDVDSRRIQKDSACVPSHMDRPSTQYSVFSIWIAWDQSDDFVHDRSSTDVDAWDTHTHIRIYAYTYGYVAKCGSTGVYAPATLFAAAATSARTPTICACSSTQASTSVLLLPLRRLGNGRWDSGSHSSATRLKLCYGGGEGGVHTRDNEGLATASQRRIATYTLVALKRCRVHVTGSHRSRPQIPN